MLDATLEEWGGLANFLTELHEETAKLPKGHANRVKVQMMIFQELMKAGHVGDEDKTLEEQEAELKKLVSEYDGDEDDD